MYETPNTERIRMLDPKNVWQFFTQIAAIPRPSKHEQRIATQIKALAQQHQLAVREDAAGNVLIEVPATPGCANAPNIVLQGHLDMVCEKNGDVQHDFDHDPIRLLIDRDAAMGKEVIRADGTTLGADNGIGVAMALAAATSPNVVHGPLELLFTTDEEAGMSGAKALTPQSFRARTMLNLDSEEDDTIYIGCAGGCDSVLTWRRPVMAVPPNHDCCHVYVTGLRGGHSGGDIHENRANAIKLLARTLNSAAKQALRLVQITGGSKRNAIPREATALLCGSPGTIQVLMDAAVRVQQEARSDHGDTEASVRVESFAQPDECKGLSVSDTGLVVSALTGLPNGVLGMSTAVPGLVETSNNVSIVQSELRNDEVSIEVSTLSRSSSSSELRTTLDRIGDVARASGAAIETGNDYPGWEPNTESPVLALCRRVYQEQFGVVPQVTAIHAGLECGVIGDRVKGMDMVSFGPTIVGAHSPDERVFVDSVQKSWRLLLAVLKALATAH